MSIKQTIESKLAQRLSPESLLVLDESHLHAGHHHGGDAFDGSGETHFRVRIVAPAFAGMSRVERHRAVNAALSEELAGKVHALAIEASAPGESLRRG